MLKFGTQVEERHYDVIFPSASPCKRHMGGLEGGKENMFTIKIEDGREAP